VEVTQYREDVSYKDILHELMDGCDLALPVDCADRRVPYIVQGWFIFPDGSLSPTSAPGPA
jgi:hypothetical protein